MSARLTGALVAMAALLAAGTAFCPDGRKHPGLWAALALLLAARLRGEGRRG